ncbi:hypothetical protein UPYG_G00096420 [Umbra pygmaea]|uniref:SAND domain-containing protein n=1 Tax=Umbra pygmaea TaxID=75934 RepID=A0ABD0WZY5_UMBPY
MDAIQDPLDGLSNEDLLELLRCNRTKISCLEQPHTFLFQLRDDKVIPEQTYQKLIQIKIREKMDKGVYKMLECLENQGPVYIKLFWSCVFKDHLLKKYDTLRQIRNSLRIESGRRGSIEKGPEFGVKDEQPSTSTQSHLIQKSKVQKPTLGSTIKTRQFDVSCGGKKAKLNKKKFGEGKECIFYGGTWMIPIDFAEMAGEKNWKHNIRVGNQSLHQLIKKGNLTSTNFKRRTICQANRTGILSNQSASLITGSEASSSFNEPLLKVTCGELEAILDRAKFAEAKECIFYGGRWMIPIDFQDTAGKEIQRNWKTSIKCGGQSLQQLIEKGHLTSPRFKRRTICQANSTGFVSNQSASSVTGQQQVQGQFQSPGSSAQGDVQRPIISTQRDVQRPIISTQRDVQRPITSTQADIQRPISSIQRPMTSTQADVQRPISSIQRPIISTQTNVQRPISSIQRPMTSTQANVQRPITSIQRPITSTQRDVQRPITSTQRDVQRPIISTQRDVQRPITSIQRPITSTQRDVQRPITSTQRDVQRPIISTQRDVQRPITSTQRDVQRPITSTQRDVQRPITSIQRSITRTQTNVQRPIPGTRVAHVPKSSNPSAGEASERSRHPPTVPDKRSRDTQTKTVAYSPCGW